MYNPMTFRNYQVYLRKKATTLDKHTFSIALSITSITHVPHKIKFMAYFDQSR